MSCFSPKAASKTLSFSFFTYCDHVMVSFHILFNDSECKVNIQVHTSTLDLIIQWVINHCLIHFKRTVAGSGDISYLPEIKTQGQLLSGVLCEEIIHIAFSWLFLMLYFRHTLSEYIVVWPVEAQKLRLNFVISKFCYRKMKNANTAFWKVCLWVICSWCLILYGCCWGKKCLVKFL